MAQARGKQKAESSTTAGAVPSSRVAPSPVPARLADVEKPQERKAAPALRPSQLAFLAQVVTPALQSERDYGIPACVTIAQAILESAAKVPAQRLETRGLGLGGNQASSLTPQAPATEWQWGGSILFREANNPFGIKWTHKAVDSRQSNVESSKPSTLDLRPSTPSGRPSTPEHYTEFSAQTWEIEHGKLEEQRALFQRFPDLESAFRAHAVLFLNSARYAPAMAELVDSRLRGNDVNVGHPRASGDPAWQRFAVAIMNCGYSTDRPELCRQPGCPHYAGKLIKLVNDYRLNDARALGWYAEGKDPGAVDGPCLPQAGIAT